MKEEAQIARKRSECCCLFPSLRAEIEVKLGGDLFSFQQIKAKLPRGQETDKELRKMMSNLRLNYFWG